MHWLLIAALLLTGCAASVTYDYEPGAVYLTQDSFSFLKDSPEKPLSLDERRIRAAIDQALTAKDMRDTVNADADILVDYRIEDAKRLETSGISYGIGFGGHHSLFGVTTAPEAREVTEGRLVVEVIDPRKNQIIWRATSRRNLTPNMEPEDRSELIREVVGEMFANYPPGQTSP